MKTYRLAITVVCSAALLTGSALGQPAAMAPPPKVGAIYLVGNEVTRQDVIMKALPPGLAPGQTLQDADLRAAERKLDKLGVFENNRETGVRPTLEVFNRAGDKEYKDVLIRVQETSTRRLRRMVGINSRGEPVVSLVFEERNFDPSRFPTSWDDLVAGRAFRGGGLNLRVELVQIPLVPLEPPGFLRMGSLLAPIGR